VLCPLTEAYLGDGLFPARAHAEAGGTLAVGSDSNVRLDAVEELRMLEYGQRLKDEARARFADRTGLGAALWHRLCEGGRRALRLPVGRLAAGSFADIVVVDPDHPDLAGAAGPAAVLDALVTAGDRSLWSAVYTGGRRVPDPCPELVAEYGGRVRELMGRRP
jgi:cytosine/adenosine deaminase-related metal-dependent hydrolase